MVHLRILFCGHLCSKLEVVQNARLSSTLLCPDTQQNADVAKQHCLLCWRERTITRKLPVSVVVFYRAGLNIILSTSELIFFAPPARIISGQQRHPIHLRLFIANSNQYSYMSIFCSYIYFPGINLFKS